MTTLLDRPALSLRRDRGLIDAAADAAVKSDVFLFSYVVEAGDEVVLRATTDFSLSQALKDALAHPVYGNLFGGVSLALVDAQGQPLLLVRRESGLTGKVIFSSPTGEPVWTTSTQGSAWMSLLDASGQAAVTIERSGTLYPTYTCSSAGARIGVVDAKFNGLAEVLNKTNRYELTFAPGSTEQQRLAVVAVGLVADLQFGGNT